MRPIAAALALLLATSAVAQGPTTPTPPPAPRPEDMPRPGPVTLGAPGQGAPDITRFLLVRSPRGATLTGDGRWVAYISDVTGVPQIWVVPAAGGFPQQLTYGSGVDWVQARPGGSDLLYGADTDGDERVGINLLSIDGTAERNIVAKSPAFRVFGTWSPDGKRFAYSSTERNGRDFDVYVADVATGQTRRVYEGKALFLAVAWAPDGDRLVLTEQRGDSANNLYLLNLNGGGLTTLFKPRVASAYDSVHFAPDGKALYLITNEGADTMRVARYDLARRRLQTIADPGYDIGALEIDAEGRRLAWTTIETGFTRLHVRDLTTAQDVKLPALPDGMVSPTFAHDAPVLLLATDSPTTAGEVRVWNLDAGDEAPVVVPVDSPGLDLAQMVAPEAVKIPARDGAPLTGLLYLPKTVPGGGRPPVFLNVHGGPSSFAMPSFDYETQYYVSRGIAVLDINYRGSSGQGRAFSALNDREKKVDEVGDLADAVAWLRKDARVDGSRVAVGGGSYGGYLTNQALGTYPDMFVAGVSIVGVSDWVTALEGASPSLKASDRLEFGDIADPKVRAFYAKLSPINNVAKIRTPLLVMHGANDPRDPVTESDRLVEGIRAYGGQVTYLRFPDEGHGISKLANRVYAYRAIAAFLEEKFGMAGTGAVSQP